jgi:hypothetical protein
MSRLSELTPSKATTYLLDVGERVFWTFLQAFLGLLVVGGAFDVANVADIGIYQSAAVGGAAAVLSLLKSTVASFVGKSDTAALLPKSLDHK